MSNVIESFFVSLGFEVNTEKLDEFQKKADVMRANVVRIGAVMSGAAVGLGLFVSKVAEGIDQLADFAEIENVSVEALQEIGHAAQLNGSSLDAVKASVSGVNRVIGEAILGLGRGAKVFEKLGMSAKNADGSVKTFDQLLAEVAKKMEGLSRQESIALATKLGIDKSLIPLLQKGSEEFENLRAEARAFGVTSEEDAKKASDLVDILDRTKFIVGSLAKSIAVGFMPQVTGVLERMREWFMANKAIINSGINTALTVFTTIIGMAWGWLVRIVGVVSSVVTKLFEFKAAAYLAAAAVGVLISAGVFNFFVGLADMIFRATVKMAAFNATALLIPAVIGAIILAIGLLIDDYLGWKEGNDSVIGGLVEQFPQLLNIIESIEKGVGAFIDFWLAQWDTLKGPMSGLIKVVWTLVSVIAQSLWPVIKLVFTVMGHVMAAVIPIITLLIEWVAVHLVGAIESVVNAITLMVDVATTLFSGIIGIVSDVITTVVGSISSAIDWVMGIVDSAQQKVTGFIDSVVGAISQVGALLGLTDDASNVRVAVNSAGDRSAVESSLSNRFNAAGGIIGRADNNFNNATSSSQTTTITAPITIHTPDPAKAGEAVKTTLDRLNKQAVRNGQTTVAL